MMREFENIKFDFAAEIRDKKRTASGARHRKRGNKTSFVSLPSDHMTASEWKKKNGKVGVYHMNDPMTWVEFKAMPIDLQQQYIDFLVAEFGVSMTNIGDLFGVTGTSVSQYLHKIHYNVNAFPPGKKMKADKKDTFMKWIAGEAASKSLPQDIDTPMQDMRTCSCLEKNDPMCVTRFDMEFFGKLNAEQITNTLLSVAKNKTVTVRVICDVERF